VEQLVTVKQAAEIIGISTRWVYQLLADDTLHEAGRAGRTILLARADVERLATEGWAGRRRRSRGPTEPRP